MLVKITPEIGNTFQTDMRDIDDIGRSITTLQDIAYFRNLQYLRSIALTLRFNFIRSKKISFCCSPLPN